MRALLPACFAVCEVSGDVTEAMDDPQLVSSGGTDPGAARPDRRAEFATGRWCARRALGRLDPALAKLPLPVGDDRAPVWPAGVVGSITHCAGLRCAVAARRRDVVTVGIDAEPARPLPTDSIGVILRDDERQYAESLLGTVVFTVKEALFKAWWPITHTWLDFQQARVTLSGDDTGSGLGAGDRGSGLNDGSAQVDVLLARPDWPADRVQVRWSIREGLVRTAVWIPVER